MKKKPIFRKILVPLMGLVIVEILILVCTMFGQGLIQELNANEEAVVNGKVSARKSYFESTMINSWMNVGSTVDCVNSVAQRLLAEGDITMDTLDDSSEACALLLEQTAANLIEMMRSNHVTGVYIILNTEDLEPSMENGEYIDKPGIYLRDSDPSALASERNEDILIERSPMLVVQKLGIATDTSWKLRFEFSQDDRAYYDFLYYPFQTAYHNESDYTWQNMGYWSAPYQLEGEGKTLISYSVPLILEDGTVYGVLGVDLTLEYMQTMLPYEELDEDGRSAYFLAQYSEETGEFSNIFGNGDLEGLVQTETNSMHLDSDGYYAYMEQLQIYSSNAPFSEDQWVFAGIVSYESLQSFVKELEIALIMAVLATLAIGIGGSLIISYMMQRPVARLALEMKGKDARKKVKLHPTGILEIDQMSEAVEQLSRDVIDSGRKFSKIIEMASVRLAGFQMNRETGSLFLTEHFFSIFGRDDIEENGMTIEEFDAAISGFRQYYVERDESVDGYIFCIPQNGRQQFVRVRILEDGALCYGLAEDVTQSLLEKRILKHERDHDSLTNLYNRRAFQRRLQELFDSSEDHIGIGAFLMIDLDNLKYVNDTYGHEYGDRYIKQAAAALEENLSGNVCYARISGDEFNVFIYGHDSRTEVEENIRRLQSAMNSGHIPLPDGRVQRVHATGGVAWYPDDSRSVQDLLKYADYAMYTVKRSHKGEFGNFNMQQFQSQDELLRSSAALTRMLDNRTLYYAFQPIVDARTGKIFAYEALLRPDVNEFESAKDVMEAARREGKLKQIEELTWFQSLEAFEQHICEGRIEENTYLFINSIPNQRMNPEKEEEFGRCFGKYLKQIVLELTEEEQIDGENWEEKQRIHKMRGGKIALDDYGTGYNSEKTLLLVSPDFIKVDMAIIKEIHLSPDKRTIMEYIVNYAHERGKYIIAEGVETIEEIQTVVALGADYLQGFFFAKPKRMPDGIPEESRSALLKLWHTDASR